MLANDELNDDIRDELWETFDQVWEDIQENTTELDESVGKYADDKFDELKQM